MKISQIVENIENEEGFENKPYIDILVSSDPEKYGIPKEHMEIIKKHLSKLKLTFGNGFTSISKDESRAVTDIKVSKIRKKLFKRYDFFKTLSYARQMVIINMVYQMGAYKFSKFKKTIGYLENEDYEAASIEMLDSAWYRQMHEQDMKDGIDEENRAEWLAWIMKHDRYRERKVS